MTSALTGAVVDITAGRDGGDVLSFTPVGHHAATSPRER